MKRRAFTAVFGALLLGLAACAGRTTPRSADEQTGAGLSPAAEEAIIDKAEEFAFYDGEPSPKSAEIVVVVAKQLIDLDLLTGGTPAFYEADTQLYFTQLTGDFIGYLAKVPRNEDIPKGHALWFVMRVADLKLTSWGMEAEPLDMTKLGEPISLDIETPISPSP